FNTPAGLFHFIEQVRKLEGHKEQSALRPKAKTAAQPIVLAPGPAQRRSSAKLAALPEAAAKGRSSARLAALIGTPKRLVMTIVMVGLCSFAAFRIAKPLAFLLFAETHPEWFESDL